MSNIESGFDFELCDFYKAQTFLFGLPVLLFFFFFAVSMFRLCLRAFSKATLRSSQLAKRASLSTFILLLVFFLVFSCSFSLSLSRILSIFLSSILSFSLHFILLSVFF